MPEGRILFEIVNPKTQSIEAVKAFLSWQGKSTEPLPAAIPLDGAQLTRSKKGDCFYVTTPRACSCPAAAYHPDQVCKHRQALLASSPTEGLPSPKRGPQAVTAAQLSPRRLAGRTDTLSRS